MKFLPLPPIHHDGEDESDNLFDHEDSTIQEPNLLHDIEVYWEM